MTIFLAPDMGLKPAGTSGRFPRPLALAFEVVVAMVVLLLLMLPVVTGAGKEEAADGDAVLDSAPDRTRLGSGVVREFEELESTRGRRLEAEVALV